MANKGPRDKIKFSRIFCLAARLNLIFDTLLDHLEYFQACKKLFNSHY